MVLIPVCCPHCGRHEDVVKRGKTENEKQRYLCQYTDCPVKTFLLDDDDQECVPEVKRKILDMAVNGSGIRDTARVLNVSPSTVINELKKRNPPWNRSIARCWNP